MKARKSLGVLTTDSDLDDVKYGDQLWYDRVSISDGSQPSSQQLIPPVMKGDEGDLSRKLNSLIAALRQETEKLNPTRPAALLLSLAEEKGVVVTFGARNGPAKVEGRLWIESVLLEKAAFDSPHVQINTLVHVLVNKFFQRMKEKKLFKLFDRNSYYTVTWTSA